MLKISFQNILRIKLKLERQLLLNTSIQKCFSSSRQYILSFQSSQATVDVFKQMSVGEWPMLAKMTLKMFRRGLNPASFNL